MSDVLATDIRCQVAWVFQDAQPLGTISDASKLEYARTLIDGTAADQADRLWHHQETLAGGANSDWDLSALPGTLFGSAITIEMVTVKLLFLVNLSATAGQELRLQGGGATPWAAFLGGTSPYLKVPADSSGLVVNRKDGWPVTSGTTDTLRVHNPGGSSIDYQIVVIGTSA